MPPPHYVHVGDLYGMELFSERGVNGLPDNFPFQQKVRLFCAELILILFYETTQFLVSPDYKS